MLCFVCSDCYSSCLLSWEGSLGDLLFLTIYWGQLSSCLSVTQISLVVAEFYLSLGTGLTLQASSRKRTTSACPEKHRHTRTNISSTHSLINTDDLSINWQWPPRRFTFSRGDMQGRPGVVVPLLHVHGGQRKPRQTSDKRWFKKINIRATTKKCFLKITQMEETEVLFTFATF